MDTHRVLNELFLNLQRKKLEDKRDKNMAKYFYRFYFPIININYPIKILCEIVSSVE